MADEDTPTGQPGATHQASGERTPEQKSEATERIATFALREFFNKDDPITGALEACYACFQAAGRILYGFAKQDIKTLLKSFDRGAASARNNMAQNIEARAKMAREQQRRIIVPPYP